MAEMLKRSEINFGTIDAKNALVTRNKEARRLFLDAFVLPNNIDMDGILSGDKYIIYGSKGSGKTALLRYIMEEQINSGNATKFIIFSEDISQKEFDKVAERFDVDAVSKPDIDNNINVKDMWSLFILGKICNILIENDKIFDEHDRAKKLNNIITEALELRSKGTLEKILSKIKSGTIKFSAGAKDFAELEAAINFENADGSVGINYNVFSEIVIEKICKIKFPEDVRYNIFIDELNLAMLQQKQHRKDIVLIRDMILAIGRLNRIFTEKNVPIYIYAAVRVEVAKAINASRNELDKYLIDHGQKMQWHDGLEVERYPIFDVIEHRIKAIEKSKFNLNYDPRGVWSKYFPRDIFGISSKRFLTEVTWCNPRDIVSLFNLASSVQHRRIQYDSEVFLSVSTAYSELAWSERAEELNAEHSMTVVNNIKKLMSGFHRHFNIDTLNKFAQDVSRSNQTIAQIINTVGIERICRDMYYVGILGQSVVTKYSKKDGYRKIAEDVNEIWFHRDNAEFDSSKWMIVHKALYPCLQMGVWRQDIFGLDSRVG